MKLHLGCGSITPAGWVNIDGSWNARLAKVPRVRRLLRMVGVLSEDQYNAAWSPDIFIYDLRKPLPFPDGSASAIYAPHFITELYFEDAKRLLKDCFRVLEPGGVMRVVVSDLHAFVMEYIGQRKLRNMPEGILEMSPADRLNVRLVLHNPSQSSNFFYRLYLTLTGFHSNKWVYDAESLAAHLREAGFAEVQEMQFHQSRIQGIEEIEIASRVLGGEGVCVEGIKPEAARIT
jgi:predicted SAM-dependent methyltransferase